MVSWTWSEVLDEIKAPGLYDYTKEGYLIANINGTEVRCFNVMFWTSEDDWEEEEFAHTMMDEDDYIDRVKEFASRYDAGTKVQVYEVRKGNIMVNLEDKFVTTHENLAYCGSENYIWTGDELIEE